jgi:hypothetical protein
VPENRLEKTRNTYCVVEPESSRMCEDGTVGCVIRHLTKEQRKRKIVNFGLKEHTDGTGK